MVQQSRSMLRSCDCEKREFLMQVQHFAIPGPVLITPRRFEDARGWFCETWNPQALAAQGLHLPDFVQDNHSYSAPLHTLRGLHFQRPPRAQAKLVRCVRGAVLDVAVDARRGSPSYGQAVTARLDATTGVQLFVPVGFLHGFLTLTPEAEVLYKCSDVYAPECDGAVLWNSVGINWGCDTPILSDKDANAPLFNDFDSPFAMNGNAE
jgi:dTDP-4-dehydrorhamnose 3,5-epimerase